MALRTLDSLDLSGKRVMIRADLNVPVAGGRVADATRIEAARATIDEVLERGGTPIVISHLGRPGGERDEALSLEPVARALQAALDGRAVRFAPDCVGEAARDVLDGLEPGEVALLENLRFHAGEKANEEDFARALAALADAYVDDAFSAAHRAHASIVGLPKHLPAAAGRLMQRELETLEHLLSRPEHPYLALLGGAKVATKFGVAAALVDKDADLALGGAMANTVLHAQQVAIGRSLHEADLADDARQLISRARGRKSEVLLPVDAVVATGTDATERAETVAIDRVPSESMILDVGPRSVEHIVARLADAHTVVWNGPLGAIEKPAFAQGTLTVARAIIELTRERGLVSVVGGGDTVAALRREGLLEGFTYASMAGGAFLAWIAGRTLPGVDAVSRRAEGDARPTPA